MADNTQAYDIAAIRKLLLAAFTPEELRRFCQDHPSFQPIVDRFGPGFGKDDMVDEVMDYCTTQLSCDDLLAAVKQVNPRQYNRFKPYRLPANMIGGRREQPVHWTLTLLLNFIVVGVVGVMLALVLGPNLAAWLPCQCLWTKVFGVPLAMLAILQAGWRWRRSQPRAIDGKIEFDLKLFKIEFDVVPLLDALHLWILPNRAIYLGAVATIAVAALLAWLVPGPLESTPIVESYSGHRTSGQTVDLTLVEAAEQGIEIRPGESIRIKANLLDNVDVHCTWYASQEGTLSPEQGCAALYTAPLRTTDDVIGILVESKCRTRQRWVSIPVHVKQP